MYTDQEIYEHCMKSYRYEDGLLISIKYNRAVGSLNPTNGYLILNTYLGNKDRKLSIPVHRLIFLMHHQYLPVQVDHENRIKTDNYIDNLRPATQSEQNCNKDIRSNNTSGYTGVIYSRGKWEARIMKDRKVHHLGTFDTPELANQTRQTRLAELHGNFAV